MAFLTAGESVERMARYCRVEQMLFGMLGGWSADLTEPDAKLVMLSTADHCAWRAKRWDELLPTAPPGPDAFLTPTAAESEAFSLTADLVRDSQVARMVVAYDALLPRLRQAMTGHLERTTAVADGPVQRILAIAITDIENDLAASKGPMELVLSFPESREHAQRIGAELAENEAVISSLFEV